MTDRDDDARRRALAEIARLAAAHDLTPDEIRHATAGAEPGGTGVLVRVFGYLGGLFVFAGLVALAAIQWPDLNAAARIVITLGPGVAALALALAARGDARYAGAVAPLLLIAAALEPTGMMVAFAELGGGGDARVAGLVTAATVAMQFMAVRRTHGGTLPWFLASLFALAAATLALDLVAVVPPAHAGLTVGATALLLAVHADRHGLAGAATVWYPAGAALAQAALFEILESGPAELLFPAAAAALLYLSVILRSRGLLVVSVLGLLGFVGYYTAEHFARSLGWPLALVGFGLTLIALGALGLRLDRRYLRGGDPPEAL